ncbi:MAG: dihydrofolate reductase family protein [Pseudonocardia sp.]
MGRIVANFFISLDGVVEAPHEWHFPYFDDAMGAAVDRGVSAAGAFLMGRVLYGEWSQYWPAQADDEPFAKFINTVPKYVVSSTLATAGWANTTVVSGDVAAQLRELKASVGGDIAMSGSATTVRWLITEGLLDELNLLVHPIAVGRGQRLFEDTPCPLRLVRSATFPTGVLDLTYAPAG